MVDQVFREIDHGLYLIDAGLYRPGHSACYLLRRGDELAIFDCGTAHTAPRVMQTIAAIGLKPTAVRWVMPTHVHLDHAGGAGTLMAQCPQARLVIHHRGAQHLIDPSRLQQGAVLVYGEEALARDYGTILPVAAERVDAAQEGDRYRLGSGEILFVDTPGHANHHGCLFDIEGGTLFTGDTFGLCYEELRCNGHPWLMATTTPVAFDPAAWLDSLQRMLALNPRAVCLAHYGRLAAQAELAPQLARSIELHRDLALELEAEPAERRQQRIAQRLGTALREDALRHCPRLSEVDLDALLAFDVDLNSQGLEIWLRRRARRSQEIQSGS